MRRRATIAAAWAIASALACAGGRIMEHRAPAREASGQDPFAWLEDLGSDASMAWVRAHDDATVAALGGTADYRRLRDRNIALLESHDRIALPSILGDAVFNFWRDAAHPRGVWRRTDFDAYVDGSPQWRTVLDLDSLSAAEDISWTWQGATCLPPAYRRCLVRLSRGGAGKVQVREFDIAAGGFVEGGFVLPDARPGIAWVDRDDILVSTDFGPGTLTRSGSARIAKLWHRGTPLSAARTLLEGDSSDVFVGVGAYPTGDRIWGLVARAPSIFELADYFLVGDSLARLDIPLTAGPLITMVGDQLAFRLRSDWRTGARTYPAGALLAIDIDDLFSGARDFHVVLAPDPHATIDRVAVTRSCLVVDRLVDVRPALLRFCRREDAWVADTLTVPGMGRVDIAATSYSTDRFFFTFSGFAQPSTLYAVDADGAVREASRLPAQFDARDLVTEQRRAVSKDGTRIPYFIVHRQDMPLDGRNPTLLSGQGAFGTSLMPDYDAVRGADWLERGGVYVVANIRGGGEFGPAWHQAALREHRQRSYDDFIAVADDLVARRVTSARHLGVVGEGNGGLLAGVMLTQRPDLWNAAVLVDPLLDMKRYSHLAAGAGWMAEYGDPDAPEAWAYLQRYSPYHNLHAGEPYPRPFIYTGTQNERIHPAHARKFAARMETLGYPVWFYEDTDGGQAGGGTAAQRARQQALVFTYLWERLGPTGG